MAKFKVEFKALNVLLCCISWQISTEIAILYAGNKFKLTFRSLLACCHKLKWNKIKLFNIIFSKNRHKAALPKLFGTLLELCTAMTNFYCIYLYFYYFVFFSNFFAVWHPHQHFVYMTLIHKINSQFKFCFLLHTPSQFAT